MFDAWIPSLIIAVSTVAAFVAGRLAAWLAARVRMLRAVRAIIVLVALVVALFFWFSQSSRYALLLPVGFAAGFFLYGGRRIAPGVFEDDR